MPNFLLIVIVSQGLVVRLVVCKWLSKLKTISKCMSVDSILIMNIGWGENFVWKISSFAKKLWIEKNYNKCFFAKRRERQSKCEESGKDDSDQTIWSPSVTRYPSHPSESPWGHLREIFAIGCNRYIFFHVILICYRDSLVSPVIC